jgi:hypothetical protein
MHIQKCENKRQASNKVHQNMMADSTNSFMAEAAVNIIKERV